MPQRLLSWVFLCALVAAASLFAQAPAGGPTVTGGAELVLVAKVSGMVTMTLPGQAAVPVKQDDKVEQKAKINTGQNSSVVLVFSNGATTQLGSDTELVIEEYIQDPFADTIKVADLTDEPSASRTKLALNRGELVGNVKKLKYDKGSSFIVQTPVGAAGIRGTTFRIVFRPTGTGQAFTFSLSTAVGSVGFDQGATGAGGGGGAGQAGGGAQGGGQGGGGQGGGAQGGGTQGGGTSTPTATGTGTGTGIAVPQGQEIVLTVTTTTTPSGQVIVQAPPTLAVPVNISQQTLQQVNAVAVEIAVAVQQAVFTPPPTTPAAGGTQGTPGGQGGQSGTSQNQGQGQSGGGGTSGGSGGTSGSTGGTSGSTGGTSGSTSGSTTGSTGSTTGSTGTTTTTTSSGRGGSATTTTTTTSTGSTSNVTGQTATGSTFNAQVQTTTPAPATPPRIIPTTP